MKIVKLLKESGLLMKVSFETIQNKVKKTKSWVSWFVISRPYSRKKVRPIIGHCRLMLKKEIF